MGTSNGILGTTVQVVNVASIKHISPFRYPGGKTWLVPNIRTWIRSLGKTPSHFVEPFAGGASIGLAVASEQLASRVYLSEIDKDVASVWSTILGASGNWLADQILSFDMTRSNAIDALKRRPPSQRQRAFQTLLRNRVQRGGILAPGASLVNHGENGRGVASRWYPETLARRIRTISAMRERLEFHEEHALALIRRFEGIHNAAFFIDPPYTAGGKNAGRRLYKHFSINHEELFATLARVRGAVLMTYDDTAEVRRLANRFRFSVEMVPMKNTHHAVVYELVLTNRGTCLAGVAQKRRGLG